MFKLTRKVLITFLAAVLLFTAAFFGFMRDKYIIPVFMYHSVSPQQDPGSNALIVTPQAFERQMRFLKNFSYNVMPLEAVAELIRNKKKLPPRLVVITLDDGYKDNYTYAFPVLKKYALPATIFIITGEVGRPDRLSWGEIKEMQSSGFITFGSHCLGPEPLINIKSGDEVKRQIFESKRILEEKLGAPVAMFSYPEGKFNFKIKQLVADAGYKLAVATTPGIKFPASDVFLIKRMRISENAANPFILWFKASGFYSFFRENRRKYR